LGVTATIAGDQRLSSTALGTVKLIPHKLLLLLPLLLLYSDCILYTIKWKDTLSQLAEDYGTTVARLSRDNNQCHASSPIVCRDGVPNPDRIITGRELKICN
jgi:hypothetical protein